MELISEYCRMEKKDEALPYFNDFCFAVCYFTDRTAAAVCVCGRKIRLETGGIHSTYYIS